MLGNEIQLIGGCMAVALCGIFILLQRMKGQQVMMLQKLSNLAVDGKKNQQILTQLSGYEVAEADGQNETKLYVGNIDYSVSEQELANHFAKFGAVEMVNIPTDRYTGKARGFGFVTFTVASEARRAIDLDGSQFKGRQIQVNFARERNNS